MPGEKTRHRKSTLDEISARRVLLQVHRKGDWGSPRVTGSTRDSRSRKSEASCCVTGFRPPPTRRTRPHGISRRSGGTPCLSSRTPRSIVLCDSPVAETTAETPPQPISMASAAAQVRRILSFMRGRSRSNLRRRQSTTVVSSISEEERTTGDLSSYYCPTPKRQVSLEWVRSLR